MLFNRPQTERGKGKHGAGNWHLNELPGKETSTLKALEDEEEEEDEDD